MNDILVKSNGPLIEKYHFIRDRTRAIRQDFTLQSLKDNNFIKINEQIARFHILMGHLLCEYPKEAFDPFQNTEQLRKVLTSLDEIYTDLSNGIEHQVDDKQEGLRNESEFRAYFILTHLEDKNILSKLTSFPFRIIQSKQVQFALKCCCSSYETNYYDFFRFCSNANIFEFCLLNEHFTQIRKNSFTGIVNSFSPNIPIPIEYFVDIFGFENEEECNEFFTSQQVLSKNGLVYCKNLVDSTAIVQMKRRIAYKFIRKIPTDQDLRLLIQGQQLKDEGFVMQLTTEMTDSLIQQTINNIVERNISIVNIALQLYNQFMSNFEEEIRNNLFEYSSKLINQYQFVQNKQSSLISNEIFQFLFGQFLHQIIQEELDYAIRVHYFSKFLAVRRVVRYFRAKQAYYKELFDEIQMKCRELSRIGVDFYSFLTKTFFNIDGIPQYDVTNGKMPLRYSVLFFDDYSVYKSKIESFIPSNYTVVWINYGNEQLAQFAYSIDFYSIKSCNETLNKLFLKMTEIIESTVLIEKKTIIVQYFDSLVFNKWNLFKETDCHGPIQLGDCSKVEMCIKSLFSDLSSLSSGNLRLEKELPICCLYHLSQNTLQTVKRELSNLSIPYIRLTKNEEVEFRKNLQMKLNTFLSTVMSLIFFTFEPSSLKLGLLDKTFKSLQQELNVESEETKALDKVISSFTHK